MSAQLLKVEDLVVDFGTKRKPFYAVDGVDLDIPPINKKKIVGESGSGKSASSMSMLGLLPANGRARGSVLLGGVETIGATPEHLRSIRGRDIAVIFQEPMTAMNPVYTIGFQIVEALKVHFPKLSRDAAKARAISTRRRSPPDRDKALDWRRWSTRNSCSSSLRRRSISAWTSGRPASSCCNSSTARTLSSTLSLRKIDASCGR